MSSKREALGSISSTEYTGLYMSVREVDAGRSEVQGDPGLHSKVETALGYIRPFKKEERGERKRDRCLMFPGPNNARFSFALGFLSMSTPCS